MPRNKEQEELVARVRFIFGSSFLGASVASIWRGGREGAESSKSFSVLE